MGIGKREDSKGVFKYRVIIRKKGTDISRTFLHLEDAQLFEEYRTRLIENMSNFDVPIKERVRLDDIIDLKIRDCDDKRTIGELELASKRIKEHMKNHIFLHELTFEDWEECFKKISQLKVPIKHNSKTMGYLSLDSLRRMFATISSAFSHAKEKKIRLENFPLRIIQEIITPKIKEGKL